ncbi:MAG: PEP-CTERM sorting domain-containing protein [Ktedonobacteraceae bacterium]
MADQLGRFVGSLLLVAGVTLFTTLPAHANDALLTDSSDTWLSDIGGPNISATTSEFGADLSTLSSVSLNGGASFTSNIPLQVNQVGTDWLTWSVGYNGQVLTTQGATSVTLTPSHTGALGFEVEPDLFAPYAITVNLSNGQSITDTVNGFHGAQFFGYAGLGVNSVTISSSDDFAIGNFVAPSAEAILNNSLTSIKLGGKYLLNGLNPTTITDYFVPKFGITLKQAATDLGFTNFDWEQRLTNLPAPSPFYEIVPSDPTHPINVVTPPSISDPPPGGYTYCLSQFGVNCPEAPLYWDPDTQNTPISLNKYEFPNALGFFDSPSDTCLPGPGGLPSIAWFNPKNNTLCGDALASSGSYRGFATDLAGILPDGSDEDLGLGFTWTDTFNGTFGGISVALNPFPVDPTSGTGGITVTSFNDTLPVPEPSSGLLFVLAIASLLLVRKRMSHQTQAMSDCSGACGQGAVAGVRGRASSVRWMASRAGMDLRRAVSRTDRISA